MRAMLETSEDLNREEQFALDLQTKKKIQLVKLPIKLYADYAMVKHDKEIDRDVVYGLVEIKIRNMTFGQHPTFMISKGKIDRIVNDWNLDRFMFVLCVRYIDTDASYRWDPNDLHQVVIGGRTDRGDWQDTEPVYLIDHKLFKRF